MQRIYIKILLVLLVVSLLTTPVRASAPTPTPTPSIQFGKTNLIYELPDYYVFKMEVKTPYSQPTGGFFTYYYDEDEKEKELVDVNASNPNQFTYKISTDYMFVFPFVPIYVQWTVMDDKGNFEVGPVEAITGQDPRFEWKELSSKSYDLSVHYHDRDEAFGQTILSASEQAAKKMEEEFQANLTQPIIVVVYNDQNEAIGFIDTFTENTGGQAFPSLGATFEVISDTYGMDEWIQDVIPHEISHLYFYQATGGEKDNMYLSPPDWLNEGLAEVNAYGVDENKLETINWELSHAEKIPSLKYLGVNFGMTEGPSEAEYDQAYSVVCYLINTYGDESIAEILAEYRKGSKSEDAFINALGFGFAELDRQWRESSGLPLDAINYVNPTPTATITLLPTPTITPTPVDRAEMIIGAVSGFAVLGICCFLLIILIIILLITLSQRRKKDSSQPTKSR
jgi:hypothetical protein